MHSLPRIVLALACLGANLAAHAQDVGQHPAVFSPRQLPAIDPNTFLVGHPASPRNRAGHANSDHPAVTAWARSPAVDGNRFLVQPPAAVQWTLGSPPEMPAPPSRRGTAMAATAPVGERPAH